MGKDTYLSVHDYFEVVHKGGDVISVPVQIGADTLPEELEMCLRTVSEGNFVSYRHISAAELMIYMILEKLQILHQHDPTAAKTAGKEMHHILQSIDTDDDFFPMGQISVIQSIIDDT